MTTLVSTLDLPERVLSYLDGADGQLDTIAEHLETLRSALANLDGVIVVLTEANRLLRRATEHEAAILGPTDATPKHDPAKRIAAIEGAAFTVGSGC